ncbi:hypothetical protein FQR65_LT00918 [Abscondita terminalis]|nr:hypothetical protein FQR65_LT00918 [Abscondita terminalis]
MAVFYKRDEATAINQENLKPSKIFRTQNENRNRAPLRCITNGNGGVKRSRDSDNDKNNKNTFVSEEIPKDFAKCLELVTKENSSTNCKIKENNEHSEDIKVLKDYGKDVWKYLLDQEKKYIWPKPNYMVKQKQLTFEMRSVLIDWLVAVAHEFGIQEQTIYLSVNYIDRFLCAMSVVREKFQLLGATAMMLAIKVEEVELMDAEEWSHLTGEAYNSRQITRMEQLLLTVLKFDLNPPTVINFVQLICALFKLDKPTMYLAMFLMELSLLEGNFFLEHVPSKIAVSAIVLARYLLRKQNPYFFKLQAICGYDIQQLKPVIVKQHRTFEDSPTKQLKSIQNKYTTDKYCCVANITPISLNLEDK